jgi:nucleotide-binding universal stress UspA family protein
MRKVLLPVDGSRSSFVAVLYLIDFVREHGPLVVHVVNVQPKPLLSQVAGAEADVLDQPFSTEAYGALKPALHALQEAQVVHQVHIRLGDAAETVVALAGELGCDHIVMGTRGLGAMSGGLLGSVTNRVLQLTAIPVTCVKDQAKPKAES